MNMQTDVEAMVLEERKFLHDLSNHLVVSQGMVNIVLKCLKDVEGIDPKLIERQQKALDAMNAQILLLKARRNILHSRSS